MTQREIIQTLARNEPFKGLPNVRAENVVEQPEGGGGTFDAQFDLRFGDMNVKVYVETKTNCTPKQVEQIAPWLSRMKALRRDAAFALLCPALSPRSQTLCMEREIDFIDLAGNLSINVPGKLLIQRTGQKAADKIDASFYRNPFSGKSSRILRVLLQNPKSWTLREITEELKSETQRAQSPGLKFEVSAGFASRVLRSLEEQLLIVRKPASLDSDQAPPKKNVEKEGAITRGNPIMAPEPKRILELWAENYKKRSRWNLRSAVKLPNPFGGDVRSVWQGLNSFDRSQNDPFNPVPVEARSASASVDRPPAQYAFTSAAATSLSAPFVDVDMIDLFVPDKAEADRLQRALAGPSIGPDLRVIPPYDAGVFLYACQIDGVPIVSDIQAYLDLFARGGRDLKQADYLFEKRIAPSWVSK